MSNLTDRTYLPAPLRSEPYTAAVAEGLRGLGEEARAVALSVFDQLSPNTATWGLGAWEEACGISPDAGATLAERRAAVVAQLCSRGCFNAATLSAMTQAMTGYRCAVTEHYSDYSFEIAFVGETGGFVTADLTLLEQSVERVKPAHLEFILPNVRWKDIEAQEMTWADVEDTWDSWAALESSRPVVTEG